MAGLVPQTARQRAEALWVGLEREGTDKEEQEQEQAIHEDEQRGAHEPS